MAVNTKTQLLVHLSFLSAGLSFFSTFLCSLFDVVYLSVFSMQCSFSSSGYLCLKQADMRGFKRRVNKMKNPLTFNQEGK